MPTNIAQIPQLTGSFNVARNAGWYDVLQFLWPTGTGLPNAGLPVDLTGIDFYAQVTPGVGNSQILLDMSTINGRLVNGLTMGTLAFNVPPSLTSGLPLLAAPGGTMDLLAVADGRVVNVNQQSGQPFSILVTEGVTTLPIGLITA